MGTNRSFELKNATFRSQNSLFANVFYLENDVSDLKNKRVFDLKNEIFLSEIVTFFISEIQLFYLKHEILQMKVNCLCTTTQFGARVPLKMSVDLISFAAHADYRQISVFIREMRPPQVVLVHGEANEMGKLKKKLMDQYEDDPEGQIAVYTPKNTDKLNFYFRGEKLAKIIGGLAEESPLANKEVSYEKTSKLVQNFKNSRNA